MLFGYRFGCRSLIPLRRTSYSTTFNSLYGNEPISPKSPTKRLFWWGVFTGSTLAFIYTYGATRDTDSQESIQEGNGLIPNIKRIWRRMDSGVQKYFEPSFDILLPPPSQTGPESKPYTIVLDLDKFLVNHTWDPVLGKWRISKRPGVDLFLFYLAHMYEVVVYSSMSQMEAEPLMEKLDPYQMISYRLYRFATKYEDGVYKKDLSRLNRDMSKVIVLGHDPSFSAYPDNLIKTQPWNNDSNDTFLEDALPFLETLAFSNVPDVRTIIKPYEGNPIIETFQEKQRNSYESLRQQRLAANTSTVHRLLTKIFMPDLAREIDSGEGLMSYEERKKFISKQRKEEYNKEMSRIKIEYEKHLEASKSYLASQKMPLFDLVTKGPQPPPPPISTQQVSE